MPAPPKKGRVLALTFVLFLSVLFTRATGLSTATQCRILAAAGFYKVGHKNKYHAVYFNPEFYVASPDFSKLSPIILRIRVDQPSENAGILVAANYKTGDEVPCYVKRLFFGYKRGEERVHFSALPAIERGFFWIRAYELLMAALALGSLLLFFTLLADLLRNIRAAAKSG